MEKVIKKYVGMKGVRTYEVSPFVELSGMRRATTMDKQVARVADVETGEEATMIKAKSVGHYWKDEAPFTKLYHSDGITFSSLPKCALKLLEHVIMNIPVGKEEIEIDAASILSDMGYNGRKSVYDAIVALCEQKIIAKKFGEKHTYFVNPNKLFNGKREGLMDAVSREPFAAELIQAHKKKFKAARGISPNTDFGKS